MTGLFDIHCHILPGVDDGAPDLETALALLRQEKKDGVEHIILTPHYRRRMFEPPMEVIHEQFLRLREPAAQLGIRLYLGCEYHANMDMVDHILEGKRPTMAGSRYVLTEFKEDAEQRFIRERTMSLLGCGLIPIIAHLERCQQMRGDFGFIEELHERGCRMQMNADTIAGRDGFRMTRFAKKMVKYDLLDFVGSDAHDLTSRAPHLGECARTLAKWVDEDYAWEILCHNPQSILLDR